MRRRRATRGQAAVEAALTLPLLVFLILGTMQLFLMLQGRILAQYAAFRTVRVGSTHSGDCTAMTDAAILALIPNFAPFLSNYPGNPYGSGTPAQKLAQAYLRHKNNQYDGTIDWPTGSLTGPAGAIVWILRELPDPGTVPDPEDSGFDQPSDLLTLQVLRNLQIELVYWFPLRIPFANWVMTRMFLAQYGLLSYTAENPLMHTQQANWVGTMAPPDAHAALYLIEVLTRYNNGEYVFPIRAAATLRMMTPAKFKYFTLGGVPTHNCPPAPEFPP
jgi:hypothetical protein